MVRRLIGYLHRWIGLATGLYLAMIGLSGAGLVVAPFLFAWEHGTPAFAAEQADQTYVSPDVWLAKAERAYGALPPMDSFNGPLATPIRIAAPTMVYSTLKNDAFATGVIAVDGYTGEPIAHFVAQDSRALLPLTLHMGFFLPYAVMWTMLAALAWLLLGMTVSGAISWWPPKGGLRRALALSASPAPAPARLRHTHAALGAWMSPILAVLAVSGLLMSDKPLARRVADALGAHAPQPSGAPCAGPVTAGQAVSIARAAVPKSELATLQPPSGATGVFRITLRRIGKVAPVRGEAEVTLDACGRVMAVRGFREARAGEALLDRLVELHGGRIAGPLGEILVLLGGLALVLLPVLGAIAWSWRVLARRSSKAVD